MRLTTSLLSWGKVIWLCCAGSTLAPESLVLRRTTLLHQHLRSKPRFPTGPIKPWFHTEGKLTAALIIPSSWGSQLTCDVQALFLALLPGRYSLVNLELAMPQEGESCFIKWLREYVGKLIFGWNIAKLNITTSNMIPNKMMTNLNMLRS